MATSQKNSFLLYLKSKEVFDMLSNEQAGELIKAIFEYEETGIFTSVDPVIKIAFIPIKQYLDVNTEKYERTVEKNRANIRKRWNKNNTNENESIPSDTKNTTGIDGIPSDTKNTVYDYGFEYDSDSDSESSSSCLNTKEPPLLPQSCEGLAEVARHYEKHIGGLVSSTAATEIIGFLGGDGLEPALICRVIDEAVDSNARNWRYVRKILKECAFDGILTVEQFANRQANRIAKKERERRNKPTANGGGNSSPKPNRFINFTQRGTDYSQLEKLERAYQEQKYSAGDTHESASGGDTS